jgi:hypothetical protein
MEKMNHKKVDIRIWIVHGQMCTHGPFLTKKEADVCLNIICGGIGNISMVKRKAFIWKNV